jgi:hypothetical protein
MHMQLEAVRQGYNSDSFRSRKTFDAGTIVERQRFRAGEIKYLTLGFSTNPSAVPHEVVLVSGVGAPPSVRQNRISIFKR